MFDGKDESDKGFGSDDAFELLAELEQNRMQNIQHQRSHERLLIKSGIVVEPGNISDDSKFKVQGTTGDISEGGCRALLPKPLRVGDIYRLVFDNSVLKLPTLYAKCVSCRMVRQHGFESRFSLFEHIELSDAVIQQSEQSNDTRASA